MDCISSRWRKPKKRQTKRSKSVAAAKMQNKILKKLNVVTEINVPSQFASDNIDANSCETSLAIEDTKKNISSENDCIPSLSYIMMSMSAFRPLLQNVPCDVCGNCELNVRNVFSFGFSVKLELFCQSCLKCFGSSFSSQRQADSRRYDVNHKLVESFLIIGRGHSALETFSINMETATMDRKTFSRCLNAVCEQTENFKAKILNKTSDIVRNAHIAFGENVESDVIDITVSYDGTWMKRGHTSNHGIGVVVDTLTNLVVDYQVLSKYCSECTNSARDLGEGSAEFEIWFAGHKSVCQRNFSGASGNMEESAALILWQRSITNNGMRYTTILSDGDSKTFSSLSQKQIYGPDVPISKEECLNHVAKRLGTALRNKVKEWRCKKVTLGGRKRGSLKEETITKLQNFYRKAIKDNVPDIKAMKTAIYATLFHCMSTDAKPQHSKCPTGTSSWCFYQRALANGEVPRSHDSMKTPLLEEVVEKILPVYQRLASEELLKRCVAGKTQNANESLHNCIWSKCPKEVFVCRKRLEYAVALAVSEYNFGCAETLKLKKCFNPTSKQYAEKRDTRRSNQRKRRSSETYKAARSKKRFSKKQKKDESGYKAGGF